MNNNQISRKALREQIRMDLDIEEIQHNIMPYLKNFSSLNKEYISLLAYIRDHGYQFRSLENFEKNIDREGKYTVSGRFAYIRYDIHIVDLPYAFGIAKIHEELKVPATFYIMWDYSKAHISLREQFLALRKLNPDYIYFGLHVAPTTSWFLKEYLDPNNITVSAYLKSQDFLDYIQNLKQEVDNNGAAGPELKRIQEGTDDILKSLSESFREHFPDVTTISGHGHPLSAHLRSKLSKDSKYQCIRRLFHSPLYLKEERITPLGYCYETTFVDKKWKINPVVLYDGLPPEVFMNEIATSSEANLPIVPLIHPRRLHDQMFSGIFSRIMKQ